MGYLCKKDGESWVCAEIEVNFPNKTQITVKDYKKYNEKELNGFQYFEKMPVNEEPKK